MFLLDENGLIELVCVVYVFNVMCQCIVCFVEECVQILVVILYDLQMFIMCMKLCVELVEDFEEKCKLLNDLVEIEMFVCEGLVYVCSVYGDGEKFLCIDVGLFVESLVYDYQDIGKFVMLEQYVIGVIVMCLYVLCCVLINLIDNVIKFGGVVEVSVCCDGDVVVIEVCDCGLGILEDKFDVVLQLFVWLENLCSCEMGGMGLGLVIVQQLVVVVGGGLMLCNCEGGGLVVEVRFGQVVVLGQCE